MKMVLKLSCDPIRNITQHTTPKHTIYAHCVLQDCVQCLLGAGCVLGVVLGYAE